MRYLVCKLYSIGKRIKRRYYRRRAFWTAWLSGGKLELPVRAKLAVPLLVNGAGEVVLGERVVLGCSKSPKLGDGANLMQARRAEAQIVIGECTALSNNVSIIARRRIEIGPDCLIGDFVQIVDADFHGILPDARRKTSGEVESVKVGRNVWLGSRVMVLKGGDDWR
jgi:maltose O-acetyltransferase